MCVSLSLTSLFLFLFFFVSLFFLFFFFEFFFFAILFYLGFGGCFGRYVFLFIPFGSYLEKRIRE